MSSPSPYPNHNDDDGDTCSPVNVPGNGGFGSAGRLHELLRYGVAAKAWLLEKGKGRVEIMEAMRMKVSFNRDERGSSYALSWVHPTFSFLLSAHLYTLFTF